MPLPIVALLGWLATSFGIGSLIWYYNLPSAQQAEADRLAGHYAQLHFGKALEDLTKHEMGHVTSLVRGHFLN